MLQMFKDHPKPFYVIWTLEYWERFAYYTLQSIIALYFIKFLGVETQVSYNIFAAFAALIYGFNAVGGYLGDNVLGIKRTLFLGLIVLAIGYFFLAFANKHTVYYALSLICIGNGLFKANPANLLAKCYTQEDKRLHAAFTLYYMAVNLGSILAILIGPSVALYFGYRFSFFCSAVGIVIACLTYKIKYKNISAIDSSVGKQHVPIFKYILVILMIIGASFVFSYLLQHVSVARNIVMAISFLTILIYLIYLSYETKAAQIKMIVVLILMLEATVFFALYFQMPTSLNLFAVQHIRPYFLGIKFDPQSFQMFNPIWIVIMSPIIASIDLKLKTKGYCIAVPYKFACGMTFCAISFLILYLSRWYMANNYTISVYWLVWSYFFQSISEILVSALGLAMVAELVPVKMTGFVAGMWFLTSSLGSFIAAKIASYTVIDKGLTTSFASFVGYTNVFAIIGLCILSISFILWLIAPKLSELVKGNLK